MFLLITLFLSPTLVAIPALGVIVVLGLAALAAILSYYGPVWKCKDCDKHFTYFSLVRYVTLSPIAEKAGLYVPTVAPSCPQERSSVAGVDTNYLRNEYGKDNWWRVMYEQRYGRLDL